MQPFRGRNLTPPRGFEIVSPRALSPPRALRGGPMTSRILAAGFLLGMLTTAFAADPPRGQQGNLKVGDAAPAFTVKDVDGKVATTLSDLKGKPVVLIFGSCT